MNLNGGMAGVFAPGSATVGAAGMLSGRWGPFLKMAEIWLQANVARNSANTGSRPQEVILVMRMLSPLCQAALSAGMALSGLWPHTCSFSRRGRAILSLVDWTRKN